MPSARSSPLRAGDRVWVHLVQATGGYLAQSSKTLHVGLGDKDHIDQAEIRWPSGQRQQLGALEANRLHEITEPR